MEINVLYSVSRAHRRSPCINPAAPTQSFTAVKAIAEAKTARIRIALSCRHPERNLVFNDRDRTLDTTEVVGAPLTAMDSGFLWFVPGIFFFTNISRFICTVASLSPHPLSAYLLSGLYISYMDTIFMCNFPLSPFLPSTPNAILNRSFTLCTLVSRPQSSHTLFLMTSFPNVR